MLDGEVKGEWEGPEKRGGADAMRVIRPWRAVYVNYCPPCN